jgi:hypothetical protein
MDGLIKNILIFIGIGILNTVAFTVYLSTTGLPGGEVGMAPLLIVIESGIAIALATVTYLLIRNRIDVTTVKTILTYQVAYLLTLVFSGVNPFDNELTDVFKSLTRWTYLISFLVTIGLIMITKIVYGLRTSRD